MHRFYLPYEQTRSGTLTLTGREAHHGLRVLRVRQCEKVQVLDGEGRRYLCEVESSSKDTILLKILEREFIEPLPYRITLVQAIPKGKLFDSIVQKATELGVARVVPLLADRVVLQLNEDKSEGKIEHWRTVAIEAIKQCGSPWLPQIETPIRINDFVARAEVFDLSLVASLEKDSRHPRVWLRELEKAKTTPQHGRLSICVWVGPEGDFTAEEIRAATSIGARPITLGPLVLRCETAAIYCLSILNYEMQFSRYVTGLKHETAGPGAQDE
jgi:16S rRNA (uracil1498-N3)-methyltransferase